MNELVRKLDWTPIRQDADSGSTKPQSDRSESELLASLAEAWWARREKRFNLYFFQGLKNRPEGEFVGKEVPDLFRTPAFHLDAVRRPRATFTALQEWEGYVICVTESHVLANLVDLTSNSTRPDEQAEIPLQEFSEQDIPKLSAGKVFRWAIGYQRQPAGTKMRLSNIVVRDLPQWSKGEIAEAKDEARDLHEFLNRD
jgi:hypothetical protein